MEKIKCITFDKAAQDNLPQHIKDKMKADRDKSRKEMESMRYFDPQKAIELLSEMLNCKPVVSHPIEMNRKMIDLLLKDAERTTGIKPHEVIFGIKIIENNIVPDGWVINGNRLIELSSKTAVDIPKGCIFDRMEIPEITMEDKSHNVIDKLVFHFKSEQLSYPIIGVI